MDLKSLLEKHKKWLISDYVNGDRINLECENLEGLDLRGSDLRRALLAGAVLNGANLNGSDLTGVDLMGACLVGALLRVDMKGALLTGANLTWADLAGARLTNADMKRADLKGSDLTEANLHGADLNRALLRGALQRRANMTAANLSDTNLSGALLRGANLTEANLTRANLKGVGLNEANLTGANLSGADLTEADLRGVLLRGANLKGARFSSKSSLINLKSPLSDHQVQSSIFIDEGKKHKNYNKGEYSGKALRIRLYADYMSPINLSCFLMALEVTYNNLFYLSNTNEMDLEKIKATVCRGFREMKTKDELKIESISKGSFKLSVAPILQSSMPHVSGIIAAFIAVAKIGIIRSEREKNASKLEMYHEELEVVSVNDSSLNGTSVSVEDNSELCEAELAKQLSITEDAAYSLATTYVATSNPTVLENINELVKLNIEEFLCPVLMKFKTNEDVVSSEYVVSTELVDIEYEEEFF